MTATQDNTRYGVLQVEGGVMIYRGADQPDMSIINPEADVWQHVKVCEASDQRDSASDSGKSTQRCLPRCCLDSLHLYGYQLANPIRINIERGATAGYSW